MGSENSFYHPLLEIKQDKLPFDKFWSTRVKKIREINEILVEKYGIFLSTRANKRHTVTSLNLKVNDPVWIRIFQFSTRLKYMKHILPSFKMAKIEKILGETSLLVRDQDSGRLISRHLQDCFPVKFAGSYSNLYTDSLTQHQNETEEDYEGLLPSQIPYFDGLGLAKELLEDQRKKAKEVEQKDNWKGRLRERKNKICYKE